MSLGGGGRNKERHIGEEERSLYTTNRSPFPPVSHAHVLQLLMIDPRGPVNSTGMESVCCEGSLRGQPPDTTGSVDLQQADDAYGAALLITTHSYSLLQLILRAHAKSNFPSCFSVPVHMNL